MDYLPVSCLLLILANLLAPLECAGSTSIAPPCKKDWSEGQHCYRTALCQTCLQTEIRCYEEDDLSALKAIRFKDAFCGHYGVVLVDKKSSRVQTLLPLECSNGICPDQSECRTNPEDGISYCCSLEKLVNSRCFTLDVAVRSKEAVTRKITDENGHPVNISKVTIVLKNSDVECLQGWSYSFKEDTVYMTNQCPVRFEICYESRPPILISPNSTDPTIMCQPIELKCRTNEHKTKKILDRKKQPVTILSVTIIKQLTRVNCQQDKNFFFNGSNIFVQNGCGAKFKICYHVIVPDVSTTLPSTQRPRLDTEIRSEQGACVFIELSSAPDRLDQKKSVDAKGLPLQVRSMDVYERYSEAKCLSGQTYGFTGSLVQASGGCRATFKVCYYGIQVTTPASPLRAESGACVTVELSSTRDVPAGKTSVDNEGSPLEVASMDVQHEYSNGKCLSGVTYSFTGSTIEATGACWASFKVCYKDAQITTRVIPIIAEQGACVLVELSSTPASLTEKESVDAQGSPLEVRNMDLQHEYSSEICLTGETYGFNGSVIRASGGCNATFNVCYQGSLVTLVIGQRGACRLVQLSSTPDSPAEKKSIDVEGSPLEVLSIQLHQEYSSNNKCLPGETFIFDGSTVKATAGCRASLIVCYRNRNIGTPAPLSTVTSKVSTTAIPTKGLHTACETVDLSSETNGVAEKSFEDSQGRPLILTSIVAVNTSFSPKCLPGKTYTISGSVVRVTGDCKGRFLVCYLMNTSPHVATTPTVPVTVSQEVTPTATTETASQEVTTTPTTETDCKFVTLVSDSDTEKTIQDAQGRPVTVVSMRDIDWSPQWCDAGKTFTFSGSVVRVTGRCRGHFLVCYLKNTSPQVATTPTVPVNVSQEVTTTPTTETACKIVEFVSGFDTERTVKDSQGRPVAVISMGVIDLFPSECHLGKTFTFSGSEVRVTGRCRGKFWVCYLTNTSQQVATTPTVPVNEAICQKVTLRGRNGDPEIYSLTANNNNNTLQVVSMDLVQPLSFVKCDQWLNYYFEGSAVLSKGGCWGEFEVCYLENVATLPIVLNEPEGQSCRSITLSSIGERESQRVITDLTGQEVTVRSVRLTRQLSQTPCVLGSTFRFEGSHVVSSRGCIGIFQICFDKRDVNITAPEGEICDQEVTLFSYISDPDIYKLKVNGHTVTIRSMTLVRQISEIDCVSGDSYFFTESTLTARDGCRGVFRVCYVTRGGNNVSPTLEVVTTGLQVNTTLATSTEVTTTHETPTQETSTQETPTQETPTQETPTQETSTQETPTQEIPTQETPTQETSTQETPTQETPTQETPTQETPTQETPTQDTSTQETPTQDTPIQETSTPETSTQVFTTQETSTQVTTTPDAPTNAVKLKCENVTLISSQSLPVTKDFVDSEGYLLSIVSVKVVKEFSKRMCVEDRSFYVVQNTLRVVGNCRAVFQVCVDAGDGDMTTPTATTETDQNCENVKLMSTQKLPVKKTFIDSDGNQLPIISVTLVEQISRTQCAVDDTFSVYEYALRVFGGCKAVFRVCVGSADRDMTTPSTTTESKTKCENVKLMSTLKKPVKKTFIDSEGNQLPIISVTLVDQISKTECVEDNTFSVYEHALRVFGGCKAVFQICVEAAVVEMATLATPEGEECMKMEMDSGKSKKIKQIKIVDRSSKRPVRITSVHVHEQMSDVPCEPGETFLYEDNSVRVTGGCGAMFNICYEKEKLATPKKECTEVTLRSLQHKTKVATIKDKKHNPVRIVSAEVLTQLSHIPCILWETFNYKASLLWAGGGCRAVFKVCYEKSPV